MKSIIYKKIVEVQIKKFKAAREKKKRFGILINEVFFDFTKEISRIKREERELLCKNLKDLLMKKAEKIIDKPTNKITHIIISIGDLEKLNLRKLKNGKSRREEGKSNTKSSTN